MGHPPQDRHPDAEVLISREESRDELRRRVRDGTIERLRRGAYRPTPSATPDPHRAAREREVARAAALHRQLEAWHWFSHETAAVLHGWPTWRVPGRVHVIQAYRPGSGAASDVARHLQTLEEHEQDVRHGLPVTAAERTLRDCVLTMPALDALVVADAALRSGVAREAVAARVAERAGRPGSRTGAVVLRLADPGAESAWESWLRYVVVRGGLPVPSTQVAVPTRLGTFRGDLGWPEWRLLVEMDGRLKYRRGVLRASHDPERALFDEKRRHDALLEAGWAVVRVTAADARDPDDVVRRVAARLPAGVQRRDLRRGGFGGSSSVRLPEGPN